MLFAVTPENAHMGCYAKNNSAAGLGRGVVVCIIYEAVLQHPANSMCDDLKFI